jgi:hypothetical protein
MAVTAAEATDTREQRFLTWNPYAKSLLTQGDDETPPTEETMAALAIAYEISQLRTEIHFAAKGRSQ